MENLTVCFRVPTTDVSVVDLVKVAKDLRRGYGSFKLASETTMKGVMGY
jgi:glyceraldehyde-3-phosphate dehydrogenase/erythrose-4-phosphate dehydrogenase